MRLFSELNSTLPPRSPPAVSPAAREVAAGRLAGRRDDARRALLGEYDRDPVERDQPSQLSDERAERLVEVERRAERACAAVGGVEQVGAPPELVPQRLGLLRSLLGERALLLETL